MLRNHNNSCKGFTRNFSVASAVRQVSGGGKKPAPTLAELLARVKPFQEGGQQQKPRGTRSGDRKQYDRRRVSPGNGGQDQVVRSLNRMQSQSSVKSTFDEKTPYYVAKYKPKQEGSKMDDGKPVAISRGNAPWQQGRRSSRAESIANTLTNDVIEGVMKESSNGDPTSDNVDDYLPHAVRKANSTRTASFAQRRHRTDRRQASRRTPVGRQQQQQQQQQRTGGGNRRASFQKSGSGRNRRNGDNSRLLSDRASLSNKVRELNIAIFLKHRIQGRNGIMNGYVDAKSSPTSINTVEALGLSKDLVHNPGFAVSSRGLLSKAQTTIFESEQGQLIENENKELSPFQLALQKVIYEQAVLGDYSNNQLNKSNLPQGASLDKIGERVVNLLNRNDGLSPQDKLAIISAISKQSPKAAAAAKGASR